MRVVTDSKQLNNLYCKTNSCYTHILIRFSSAVFSESTLIFLQRNINLLPTQTNGFEMKARIHLVQTINLGLLLPISNFLLHWSAILAISSTRYHTVDHVDWTDAALASEADTCSSHSAAKGVVKFKVLWSNLHYLTVVSSLSRH